MRRLLTIGLMLMCGFSINSAKCYALSLNPVDSFHDWQESEPAGQFIRSGNTTSLLTSGKSNMQKEYPGAVGMLCSVNIESVSGSASAGLAMDAGSIGNDRIHVNLGVSRWGDNYSVYYQIQRRDSNNSVLEELAYGGQTKLITNPNLLIGLARVENEIWLYAEGYSLIKWDPLTIMGAGGSHFWLWGGTDLNPGSSISAKFSNAGIIYP